MSHANPTRLRLKVIDPKATAPPLAIIGGGGEGGIDDDVVSLRSEALRTPVESMVVFADLVASGDVTGEQRQLYAASLRRHSRRLTSLINKTLSLQRLESGDGGLDLGPVDIRALIHRAVLMAGDDERRPIDVRLPELLPLVSADAEAILEVLANFLANARAFSPGGGGITIESRLAGEMVEISIRDHGIGVEAEALPKLFRKFYRADSDSRRRGPSAGLGLTINQRIIQAHGGQVTASSKGPGKGTRFHFTLPVTRGLPTTGYVLIVEDDAAYAKLLKAEFAAVGLDTIRAADAETAERLLVDTTPRAVVLDLWLPGLQGEDLLGRIRTGFRAKVPVVMLTAKDLKSGELSTLEKSGAMAVLPKEAGGPQAAAALIAEALAPDPVSP